LRATLPTVGSSSPVISLKIDVLPAPLRPMMPHRSPSATVKVMFLKSSVAPKETPTLDNERSVTPASLGTEESREDRLACLEAEGALQSGPSDGFRAGP